MIIVEEFDAGLVLQAVHKERATSVYGVPTMFIAELNHPDFDTFDLSSLRTGIMAGSPCPPETMREVMDRMYMKEITICYGLTETSPCSRRPAPTTTSSTSARRWGASILRWTCA